MITNISESIARLATFDHLKEMSRSLTTFRELAGIENYLSGDAEFFVGIKPYEELLQNMALLIAPEITITDILCKDDNGTWLFGFTVNSTQLSFSMPDTDTDWLSNDFIIHINHQLSAFTAKRFRFVWSAGVEHADQCFDIAFIDDATLQTLNEHPAEFAPAL